ncbi:hypothetical protein C0R09_18520 [Brevibacillus laterosporus]|nr:hypothetical protein C0R09_18520 [Brevibacillus laterosporus]
MASPTEKLESFIERYKFEANELKIELGRDCYAIITTEISNIIKRNNLNPSQTEKLFNHLNDTFRLEQIHV